ncbi:hypothetical protein DFH07DRAFT_812712 [Mycena maculata]|uniref:F-box domain-containing protein n=1 Tax=Mycena maculata TaxID=230809 RepID=A0AAD7NK20_9AGAR|nr:hypothetical protein DFH07DRAFT_812712 [Mycena maculata]
MALDTLLEERNALDLEVRKHEGALSPLRRMPPELLSLIFQNALFPHYPSADTPWIISAVCSRWRNITLSLPSLWSTIVLDFRDDPKPIMGRLRAHLVRAGDSPLRITFATCEEDCFADTERDMLEILAVYSDRWETVTMSGSGEVYSDLAYFIADGNSADGFPLLRELEIIIHSDIVDDGFQDLFARCPSLRFAIVKQDPYPYPPVTLELPFSQLLRFSGSNTWASHLHSLYSASNLVDCVLYCRELGSIPSSQSTVTLPSLLRLSVSRTEGLEFLDTPALQELYGCDKHTPHLYSFLKRVGKLQKLVAPWSRRGGSRSPTPELARLLYAAPTITTLGIYVPVDLVADLFSILAPTAQNETTVPEPVPTLSAISLRVLRDVSDDGVPPPELDQGVLMETLESQWQRGSWRSVKLFCPEFEPSARTLDRMALLRAEGMQVIVFDAGRTLYHDLVSPDFRLFEDYSLFDY